MADFSITGFSTVARVLGPGDTGFVGVSGALVVASGAAVTMSNGVLVTAGQIVAGDGVGVAITGSPFLHVLAGGSILGVRANGIFAAGNGSQSLHLTNEGTVRGDISAVAVESYFATRIVNLGSLTSQSAAAVSVVSGPLTLRNSGVISGVSLGVSVQGASSILNSGLIEGGTDALVLGSQFDRVVNTGTLLGRVRLGGGGDEFDGSAGVQGSVQGEAGDDDIQGGAADEALFGGDGLDELFGGDGDDELVGGNDNDLLVGGAGDDRLLDEAGNDTLRGGDGDDSLVVGTGVNLIAGGDGNDTMVAQVVDVVGIDTLLGGAGDDSLAGGLGADVIHGGDDADVVAGAAGNDTLRGGAGDDVLDGGSDADLLASDGGTDRLTGGAGDDTLSGGTSGDVFIFGFGDGNDVVADFVSGQDDLDLRAFGLPDLAALLALGGDTALGVMFDLNGLGGGTLTLTGVTLAGIVAGDVLL